MRTQKEILKRFHEVDDFFGVQKTDLLDFMTFETAKPLLVPEFVQEVEQGKQTWVKRRSPKRKILDYLPFAYEKAEDERGLSSQRSLYHFTAWIWLDGDEAYNKLYPYIENSTGYGIDALDKIAEHYGYKRK